MRKTVPLLVITVLAAVFFSGFLYWKFRMAPGINFRELRIITESGKETSLAEILPAMQMSTIVVFGQSWCHDCHRELPRLQAMRLKHFPQVPVIVLTDEDQTTLQKWVSQTNLPLRYFRTSETFEALGVYSYPTTYILDSNYTSRYAKVGNVAWEQDPVKKLLTEKN